MYCQRLKINTQKYGKLLPKDDSHLHPWNEMHADMIGSWKVMENTFEYQFRDVTCIDTMINLPKVIPVEDEKSKIVAEAFGDR